ncbi:MAG: hypothetical protein HKM93_18750 [Desulfobacteraceae bacterium]|nr:hypothetical protein [Desulfobacteraceae bacterium]
MKISKNITTLIVILLLAAIPVVHAGEITIPNTFESGTPAVAVEVNENFTAVETAVDDNDSRIAAMEEVLTALLATISTQADTISRLEITVSTQADTITGLQGKLADVERSKVMALDSYITIDTDSDPRGPRVRFSGVNLQVVNGLGITDATNGLGNLLIGYDEERPDESDKTGSHYLVLGTRNNYTKFGGIVAGDHNDATGAYSSVSGGSHNTAGGDHSIVSGGSINTAGGNRSSISGGYNNETPGNHASISGGRYNNGDGDYSSASGGRNNTASGSYSSVSGGEGNAAIGTDSSISGGRSNTAIGNHSIVSGGNTRTAIGEFDWVAGSLFEDF